MKKLFNITVMASVILALFTACTEENAGMSAGMKSDAQPVVKFVRYTDANLGDQLVSSAPMGKTVAIVGTGLEGVTKVLFNDLDAKINPTLITPTAIVAKIPAQMPGEVSNTITLTTHKGKTTVFDFAVEIPTPSVNGISCEWAPAGSTATLYGSSFFPRTDGTIDVTFPGNAVATVKSFTNTEIVFEVPAGAAKGNIVVENDYGKGRSLFTYKDNTGLFIDGQAPEAWNNWGCSAFGTEGGIDGDYVLLKGSTGEWAWPANAIQMYYVRPDGTPIVSEGEVSEYALRMEVNSKSWKGTPMLVWFDNPGENHAVDGTAAQYHWRPYLTAPDKNFVTDGWITVTMPLSEFIYSKDEKENSRKISSMSNVKNLNMMFFGPAETDNADFTLEMMIDNIRLVKL